MKISFYTLLILTVFTACKTSPEIELKFVDEYVIKDTTFFKNTLIGGISGVDFYNETYYMVVDDAEDPRVISAKINLKNDSLKNIDFLDVIHVKDTTQFYKENAFDLESIFVDKQNNINLVSEGSINNDKDPLIFLINSEGKIVENYNTPTYFKANSEGKPRHNATFEASCKSINKQGFWVAMEGVLEADGEEPSLTVKDAPSRITFYDTETKKAIQQFVYPLDKIDRPFLGAFNVNGITAILEYETNSFFVVERAYQSDYGINGNVVKIYKITLTNETTNTLEVESLLKRSYVPIKKELVFNFDNIRDELTEGIVDNIEGITLGPKLANGNQSLILVVDDNFQKFGRQINQIIMLEIKK